MKVEYWVHGITRRDAASCVIVGRIIEGTLKVGDEFNYLEIPVTENPKTNVITRTNHQTLALTVIDMEFRRRKWKELFAGDTPGLTLSGSGIQNIAVPSILGFE